MTLGGLAVAVGELVDDAIVDVENIFRRLRENTAAEKPAPLAQVVFEASSEVRGAIVVSTLLVMIVFAPLFALSGVAGRLFTPLGVAYIVSILASTVVSLTVTPVLSYWLLGRSRGAAERRDGFVLRGLKAAATPLIRASLSPTWFAPILAGFLAAALTAGWTVSQLGREFLPPFDEGAAQVNLIAAPGASLATSGEIRRIADERFAALTANEQQPAAPILWTTSKTGRAEEDEHVMGVNITESVLSLNPNAETKRDELFPKLFAAVEDVPGVEIEIEQPIAHLISHLLSGVTAEIAVKIFGDDLDALLRTAKEVQAALADVPGIAPPIVEPLQFTPQLRVDVDRDALARYGVSSQYVMSAVEIALGGRVATQFIDGQRRFDVLLRMAEPYRTAIDKLHRLPLELPDGTRVPLRTLARVYESVGPSTINREDGRRRIVVRVNTLESDLGTAVENVKQSIAREVGLPEGCFIAYGGQFEAQQSATSRILWLSCAAIVAAFAVLYSAYPSTALVFQILLALPAAFVGGAAALYFTGQPLSVAAMVGFVSLGGVAARNGLLLVSTYLDRSRSEGLTEAAIVAGSLDRLAPVLMTALTTGIGLLPLVIGGDQPGKELLYPVATVILGGLATSTACEFLLRPGLFFFFGSAEVRRLIGEQDAAPTA